jgi:uncharacterized protein YggE
MKIAVIALSPAVLDRSCSIPAASHPQPPTIAVKGEATIAAEPDQAQIDIGVTTSGGSTSSSPWEGWPRWASSRPRRSWSR